MKILQGGCGHFRLLSFTDGAEPSITAQTGKYGEESKTLTVNCAAAIPANENCFDNK